MKLSKKTYIVIGTIVLFYFFKGNVYRTFVKYHPLNERTEYFVNDSELINYIEKSTNINEHLTISSVIEKSSDLTNQKLHFTTSKSSSNPNKLIHSQKTHCIGYANFYTSTFNYLIKKSKLGSQWRAKTCVGKLYFLGIDIHKYFDSPFFKDHDFVVIENSKTKERIYIDPTISDYFGIEKVSSKSD